MNILNEIWIYSSLNEKTCHRVQESAACQKQLFTQQAKHKHKASKNYRTKVVETPIHFMTHSFVVLPIANTIKPKT